MKTKFNTIVENILLELNSKNDTSQISKPLNIEYIKYGEICLSTELNISENETSIYELSILLQNVQEKFNSIKNQLENNDLDFDTGWTRIKIDNNKIKCLMYYSGQFEINDAQNIINKILN